MTIGQALEQAKSRLKAAGITSDRLDSLLLLELVIGADRSRILAHLDEEITEQQSVKYQSLVARRAERTPLAHLTGTREFYGLAMKVTPDVLTPRVETETMAAWAIDSAPKSSTVLDMGTGCGALAIAIAKHRPDITMTATDVSEAALNVAKLNAEQHKVTVAFKASNLFDQVEQKFDTVVTNLPYLRDDARSELTPEVTKEPAVALFGGSDGLDLYRQFLSDLPAHLNSGGYLFTECDPWQQADLIREAAMFGLTMIREDFFILGFQAN